MKPIAMMYDFDKTLCTKDMQEYSFIPRVDMEPREFWGKVTDIAKRDNMDKIIAYMYSMIHEANYKGVSIRKEDFINAGKNIELFKGVDSFFKRINDYGREQGIEIEHYIISSGLKEIIEGSPIADEFKKIYACEFHYNGSGVADWPNMVVNYTNKTQYLFRINKGVLDVFEDEKLNEFQEDRDRRIPFRNMVYLGDGLTDVPCMKLVKANGGQSIAVYTDPNKVKSLLEDRRVDFIVPADYSDGSELDQVVKTIIDKIKVVSELVDKNHKQRGID